MNQQEENKIAGTRSNGTGGNFSHALATRFNVPMTLDVAPEDQPVNRGLDPVWLEHRFELFERFCLPSVRAQDCQNFKWFVYFDVRTPDVFRSRIEKHAAAWPLLRPKFVAAFDTGLLLRHISEEFATVRPWLITTRLDNDDAIALDFIATVQKNFVPSQRTVLNFPLGFSWQDGRVYLDRQRSNPFTSLVEETEQAITILSSDHRYLESIASLKQVKIHPMWMQVIHGRNLCNQVRGVRWAVRSARKRFAVDRSAWGSDRPVQLIAESVRGMAAIAREKGIGRVAHEIRNVLAAKRGVSHDNQ